VKDLDLLLLPVSSSDIMLSRMSSAKAKVCPPEDQVRERQTACKTTKGLKKRSIRLAFGAVDSKCMFVAVWILQWEYGSFAVLMVSLSSRW